MIRRQNRSLAIPSALVATLLVLAGCGGGGGSSAPVPIPLPSASTTPLSGPKAILTVTIPLGAAPSSSARNPRYVSPNSAALRVTINTIDGNATLPAGVPRTSVTQLSTGAGGNCTIANATETCTVPIPAPSGNVSYTFTVLDANQNALATNTVSFTIAPGSSPNLTVQLQGIVATVKVTSPTLTPGTPFSGPMQVEAFDASGALVVGSAPYANPVTLTDTDTSGHTSLTVGSTTGLTVVVTSPQTVVTLNYDGGPVQSFAIGASGPGMEGGQPVNGGGNVPVVGQATPTPSPAPTPTPTAGASATPTAAPTDTPSPGPGVTPSPTPGPGATPSPTPSPGATPSPTPSPVVTPSPTPTPVVTPSPTPTPVVTPSPTPTPVVMPSPTPTPVPTPTPTPTPVPATAVTFSGTDVLVDAGSPSDPNFGQPTLFFATVGTALAPESFTATQTSNVGGFTIDPTTSTCSGIATVAPAGGNTFSVTAQSVGVCHLTVLSNSGGSGTIYVSITAAAFGIDAKPRR